MKSTLKLLWKPYLDIINMIIYYFRNPNTYKKLQNARTIEEGKNNIAKSFNYNSVIDKLKPAVLN